MAVFRRPTASIYLPMFTVFFFISVVSTFLFKNIKIFNHFRAQFISWEHSVNGFSKKLPISSLCDKLFQGYAFKIAAIACVMPKNRVGHFFWAYFRPGGIGDVNLNGSDDVSRVPGGLFTHQNSRRLAGHPSDR